MGGFAMLIKHNYLFEYVQKDNYVYKNNPVVW